MKRTLHQLVLIRGNYCEQGIDAIETKKSKNSVISKDIYESVAKKTGLPIESVIKIIDKKKKEYQKNNK